MTDEVAESMAMDRPYKILENTSKDRLELDVIRHMDCDYLPIGGVAVTDLNNTFGLGLYTQAVLRQD